MTNKEQGDMLANLAFVSGVLCSLPRVFKLEKPVEESLIDAEKRVARVLELLREQNPTG